ncbi:deaminase domain-containing protein [Tenacibaculum sp. UWU-22]|uniref:deaminase domain-containing protein n=1 Tax=Tenacibaculum sp. UWU-22 TaxID=3234187 RepID=UPI0034DAF315
MQDTVEQYAGKQYARYSTQQFTNQQLPTTNCQLKSCLLLTVYCLLFIQLTYAQRYPVQVTQSIIPPYSTKLSDYATASDVKLRLNLLLTDVVVSNKQVQLKLHIKGNGLNIHSTDFVSGASPIFLNGGVLQQFTNIDLATYFQPNNLTGITPQEYNKPLPEGMYTFCWEVYDVFTHQQLNHPTAGCSSVYLLLNDPPFLNLPYKGDQIVAQDPMNIIFQWTPRHTNATNVSYEFELRELWDNQIDPQAAFLASPNYYTETTHTTTLLYNIGKPTLLPNRRYGWRVRARSTTGVSENAIFKNDGYSEIYYFTYTNACYPPTFALSEIVGKDRVKITWQGHTDHKKYHVQYKRADIPDAEWFEVYTYNTQVQLSNLRAGKTYDFRVGGTCNELTDFNQSYSYSHTSQFTMPAKNEIASSYNCGIIPEIQIHNNKPIKNIGVNETFTAGDFPVTVKQIQGGNGRFTGVGYIIVPYLGDTKIAVRFTNISINTDYQLIDGVIQTTYDPTWGDVEDTNDWVQGGIGNAESTKVDFTVSDVQIDPNGDILVIGKDGEVVELPGGEDTVITDSNGQVWTVDEQGNVGDQALQAEGGASTPDNTNGVNTNGQATTISAKGVVVTFTKASDSKYGFDSYQSNYSATKELYKKLGNDYYIPYKAVAKNDTETIVANLSITDSSINPQDVLFKTKEGVAIAKIDSTATSYTLQLKGVFDDAEIETQALVKQGSQYEVAGAFIQYQAAVKNVKVTLVNTTNTDTEAIKKELQNIYKQAMVNFTITEINDFKADLEALTPNGIIESGESGFAAQYTEQQRQINNELKQHPQYQQDAYYIILTDKTPSSSNEKGLMPLGRQFGYIYTNNCTTANCIPLTSAHELGHGAFQLKHPFSKYSYQYPEKATNWLLDYKEGTKLPFVHWQAIHNPKLRIGIFDSDGEGEYTYYKLDYVCVPIEYQNRNYTYFDLDGNPIILGEGYAPAAFVGSYTPAAEGRISVVRETSSGDLYYPIAGENKKYYWKYKDGAWQKDKYGKKIKFDKFSDGNRTNARLVSVNKTNKVLLNGQETGEVFEEARNCPIRPKSSSSSEENIRCVQMNHTKSVNAEIIATVKSGLSTALNNIDVAKTQKERSLGSFSHIFQINNGASVSLSNSEKEWDVLEDKLHLLSYHKPNTYFVVGLLRTENNNLYTSSQLREIATQAIDQQSNGKNIVLVLINGSVFESLFGETTTVCSEMGFAQSSTDIVDENLVTNTGGNLADLLSIYASIEKPLILNKYYQYADGTLQNYLYQSNKNIRGYSFINHLSFYQSVAFKEYQQMRFTCSNNKSFCETDCDDADSGYNCDECEPNYNSCLEKGITYVSRELEKEYAQGALANTSFWSEIDINKIARFREIYMDYDGSQGNSDSATSINAQKNYTFMLWQQTANTWTWWRSLKIASGLGSELVDDVHFYDFDKMAVVDNLVLGTVDVAGLIPGLDTFADPIGAIYAGIRGDYQNATIYAASFAIPFAGAAYIKGGKGATKHIDEMYGIVARQANNADGFILESKRLSEITANEFHVSSVLHSGDKKLIDKALIDSKQYIDGNFVRSQVDELAAVVNKYGEAAVSTAGGKIIRQATQADLDLITSIRMKYNAGAGRNIAFSKGTIGNDVIDLECVSGAVTPQNALQKGNFTPPQNTFYDGILGYENHTEQKIVEYLRAKYLNNKNVSGAIEIVSERPYCENCIDIVDQFQAEFKNITITRVEVVK